MAFAPSSFLPVVFQPGGPSWVEELVLVLLGGRDVRKSIKLLALLATPICNTLALDVLPSSPLANSCPS